MSVNEDDGRCVGADVGAMGEPSCGSNNVVPSQIINVISLMNEFGGADVRGHLASRVIYPIYGEDTLKIIDELRCHLIPQFKQGHLNCISARVQQSEEVLKKLLTKSVDIFPFVNADVSMSYCEVYDIIDNIAASEYWTVHTSKSCSHSVSQLGTSEIKHQANKWQGSPDEVDKKPKRRVKIEDVIVLSSDESTSSLSSQCSTSSDSDNGDTVVHPRRRKQHNREVVTPPMFRMDGKNNLGDFLYTYEQYFARKYSGSEYDKSQLLANFLEGDLLNVYHVKGGRKLKYGHMKKELVKWYTKQKVGGKSYWKTQLEVAFPEDEEKYDIYAMRLLELGELAYGPAKRQAAKHVRNRFLATINPKAAEKILDAEEMLKVTGSGSKFDMAQIMELATKYQKKLLRVSSVQFSRPLATTVPLAARAPEPRIYDTVKHEPSQTSSSKANVVCHFCKRRGHMQKDCWRKTKSCLICGEEHFIKDCPKFDPQHKGRSEPDAATLN